MGIDRQLAMLVAGARLGCAVRVAIGAAMFVATLAMARTLITMVDGPPPLFALALGAAPAGVGIHVAVRGLLRAAALGRLGRAPASVTLAEMAMRWGQPALRVHFDDGASETIATGRLDRNLLIDAIRRRGVATTAPAARVVPARGRRMAREARGARSGEGAS